MSSLQDLHHYLTSATPSTPPLNQADKKRSKKYSRICLEGGTGSLEYIFVALLKTSSLPQLGSITGFVQIRTGALWECMGT